MKRVIKYITLADLVFLVMMVCAGFLSGALSEAFMVLAYALPFLLLVILGREYFADPLEGIKIKKGGALLPLTLGPPTVLCVMGIAALTSLVIQTLGGNVEGIPTEPSFIYSFLLLALAPALLEELLFRYMPMKMLLPHSGRACVWLSAVMFAAAHTSLQSIPYAFFAGVLFMVMDIAAGSVLPSVILHFINNILSVSIAYYGAEKWFKIFVFVIFGLLICLSLTIFIVKRKKVILEIRQAFSRGESYGNQLTPLAFIIPCLVLAVAALA